MKKLLVAILILLTISIAVFFYWRLGNSPANPNDRSTKVFVVNRGETIREIGNSLKREGLLRDPVVFFIYIKLNKQDKNIQAGDYRLSPSMNLKEVVQELSHGTLDRWVTVPEGVRAEEIADILKRDLPSFHDDWREELNSNEGYLFPDTYLIPKDADVKMVISIMRNNFLKKIQELGLSQNDPKLIRIIIIASLIEREARYQNDMPIVSSVIHNRLALGMKLDIDATVQYALGYRENEKRWWKRDLTYDDLAIVSPFNTYRNAGLPPTPIANPGSNTISAAQSPFDTNYLYYVSDKSGRIHPATTIQEHNENIKKYL